LRTLRLALGQINPTVGDLEGNSDKIIAMIGRARDLDADLVAFPEMAITGYPAEDLLYKESFIKDNLRAMERVIDASRDIAVAVGFVDADADTYNACAVGFQGQLVDTCHKVHLPTYGVFDEDRYFKAGATCPVYLINGVRVGINICEDIWYPAGPISIQRDMGAEVIVNINASPYHAGKSLARERMIATRAVDNSVYVAYLNTVGGQDELVFDGGSMVFDQAGNLLARAPQFCEDLLVADLDADALFSSRLHDPRFRKDRPGNGSLSGIGTGCTVQVSPVRERRRHPLPVRNETCLLDSEAEVYGALVLGTRDYVQKSGFSKVLIGISGGIDSALTACVAVDALGKEKVVGVAMPSRYSSEGSVADAKVLAHNLGIDLWEVPILPAHDAFLDMLKPHFGDLPENVAEENLQSRIRGNIIMSLSNKFGFLILTTGNKSEMAMGYATLYGDMVGGFAVLKDVPKTLVYDLARWRNANAVPGDAIPEAILVKAPSAELKPGQKDQDTLPPYDLLDAVVKAYVEEDRSYRDMVDMGFDAKVVKQVIATVDRNEYKRRQAPPGVKITPRAFGKDRRLPIVNRYRQF